MALNEYEGTVMLVSHDRALLREVCDEFWLVAGGGVQPFDGDLDDYQQWLLEQSREAARAAKATRADNLPAPAVTAPPKTPLQAPPAVSGKRDERKAGAAARQKIAEQTKPLKAELARVEKRMAEAIAQRERLTEALARPDSSPIERAEQGRQLRRASAELEALEARWLELGAQIEALAAT